MSDILEVHIWQFCYRVSMAVSVVKTWGGQKQLSLSTRAFGSYCHVIQDLVPKDCSFFLLLLSWIFCQLCRRKWTKAVTSDQNTGIRRVTRKLLWLFRGEEADFCSFCGSLVVWVLGYMCMCTLFFVLVPSSHPGQRMEVLDLTAATSCVLGWVVFGTS